MYIYYLNGEYFRSTAPTLKQALKEIPKGAKILKYVSTGL